MKYFVQILVVGMVLVRSAAGAVPQEMVSSDAKWLLHFDVEQLRATKLGGYLIKELQSQLTKPIEQLKTKLKFEIDQDRILQQINSITVYGTAYQSPENTSVLMVRTDATLEKVIVGALAGGALAGTDSPATVTQTQMGGVSFYSIGNDKMFVAYQPGKVFVIGKSRDITEKAARVLAGKASVGSPGTELEFAL